MILIGIMWFWMWKGIWTKDWTKEWSILSLKEFKFANVHGFPWPGLLFVPLEHLGYSLFISHYIFFIVYYLFRPCQNKIVTYTSHSAFDFFVTPTWCAARLKLRMWSGCWWWIVCITFNCLINQFIILVLIS